MSSDGSPGSVSGWPVRRSVSHRGRGDITSNVTAVRSRPDRRGPPASPVRRTRRSCRRSKSKRCWTCCARTASLMAASGNAGRHCSMKASTCARNRRCTGSCVITLWQVNAVNADRWGGTRGRDWRDRPEHGLGVGHRAAARPRQGCLVLPVRGLGPVVTQERWLVRGHRRDRRDRRMVDDHHHQTRTRRSGPADHPFRPRRTNDRRDDHRLVRHARDPPLALTPTSVERQPPRRSQGSKR